MMKVSVFGGSQPKEGSAAYAEAIELGKSLAERGHIVLTGGYMGTMEAVSRGAAEAGGHVIGVTCEDIEHWRAIGRNTWVKEEVRKKTLMDRLMGLIDGCDAALALPGGPGTLTEISLMWNLMIIGSLHRRPLILIGDGWQTVFDQVFTSLGAYSPDSQRTLLQFAPDIQTAVDTLANYKLEG
ncbi:MAG TPA: LOG family protein [Anaerolineales bacterium]|jgi:uncharacterized protein (TIGR00725 family)|nr:LOG family protein [Anaerolineales bacterium]